MNVSNGTQVFSESSESGVPFVWAREHTTEALSGQVARGEEGGGQWGLGGLMRSRSPVYSRCECVPCTQKSRTSYGCNKLLILGFGDVGKKRTSFSSLIQLDFFSLVWDLTLLTWDLIWLEPPFYVPSKPMSPPTTPPIRGTNVSQSNSDLMPKDFPKVFFFLRLVPFFIFLSQQLPVAGVGAKLTL